MKISFNLVTKILTDICIKGGFLFERNGTLKELSKIPGGARLVITDDKIQVFHICEHLAIEVKKSDVEDTKSLDELMHLFYRLVDNLRLRPCLVQNLRRIVNETIVFVVKEVEWSHMLEDEDKPEINIGDNHVLHVDSGQEYEMIDGEWIGVSWSDFAKPLTRELKKATQYELVTISDAHEYEAVFSIGDDTPLCGHKLDIVMRAQFVADFF
ncbi:hypothetical protein [Vibrio barjaei]|uniref:hypothetical protein n=1 Tax=Vibrio barjaei TaxID=1676683 RepID=UPI002283379A|nr:hypothetical protein [Vibrio barjaei]MCY9870420.1 hypothetical protein [Vibrio barjaei]